MDVCRWVILSLNFVTDKNYLDMSLCVGEGGVLILGKERGRLIFKMMEKIYSKFNLGILTKILYVCASKQGRIWPTKMIGRKI